jgi:hypothetical protein
VSLSAVLQLRTIACFTQAVNKASVFRSHDMTARDEVGLGVGDVEEDVERGPEDVEDRLEENTDSCQVCSVATSGGQSYSYFLY